MPHLRIIACALLASIGLVGQGVCADPPSPSAVPPAAGGGTVVEAKPELYYMRDKNGKLQPVLGFTLDDFDRLITQDGARQQGPTRPTYKLDKITVAGQAKNLIAELTVRFNVLVDSKDWVRVPLRLSDAVLRDRVVYAGPGEYRLDFDEQAEEYVVFLRGQSPLPHALELQAVVPLVTVSGETRLKLNLPRAWSSELTLTVPGSKMIGQVTSGATLNSTKQINNATEFQVLGVGNEFGITWRAEATKPANTAAVLEATGAIQSRIDGRSVHSQARLTVRSFGGEFDTFRVRLPKGAAPIIQEMSDYSLTGIPPAMGKSEPWQVEVRLKNRTTGPVNVVLDTEQTLAVGDKPAPVELGGFEVLTAVRQWGHVAVLVEGDWQVLWDTRRSVRQVDALPPELDQSGLIAGFEYFAQPFVLTARVAAKESRVHVEPRHLMLVHERSVELETRLKFRVGGARIFEVRLDLGDWKIDAIEPDTLVHREQLVTSERSPLTIPLRQGTAGEFELIIRAQKVIDDPAAVQSWQVPQPQTSTMTPAQVIVVPDDDIDLQWHESSTSGLVRQYVKPAIEPPPRQQAPLVFQATGNRPFLSTSLQLQQRTMESSVEAQLQIDTKSIACRSLFTYRIARQAVDYLTILAPAALIERGQLEVKLDDLPLTWSVIADAERDADSPQRLRVALPAPKIGLLRVEVLATVSLDRPLGSAHETIRVPLAMPVEGDFHGATLQLEAQNGISCHPGDGFWNALDPVGMSRLRLSSRVPRTEAALELHQVPIAEGSLVIERCYLQSLLTTQGRWDRLALVVSGTASQLALDLPAEAEPLDALCNGKRVTLTVVPQSTQVVVPLQATDAPQRVELSYRQAANRVFPLLGPTICTAPRFAPGIVPRQVYWQLVLSPDNHLVSLLGPATLEYRWGWRGWRWGRWPIIEQAELEAWASGTPQPPLPERAQVYLLQSFTGIPDLTLLTARRAWLVLWGTGSALLLGLSYLQWPILRRGFVVLIGALLATAGGLLYPDPAQVLAMAALPALCLTGLAAWLKQRSLRNTLSMSVHRSGAASASDRVSTRTHVPERSAISSGGSGTATAQFPANSLIEATPSAEGKT